MTDIRRERYINPYTDFGFKKLFEQAEIARYDESERRQYYESQKEYWDYTSTMDTALNKGLAEGLAKGLAKGRAEGRAEGERKKGFAIALNLKQMGMAISDIAKVTGLSVEDIEALHSS